MTHVRALDIVWLVWVASWWGAAWWSKQTVNRPAVREEATYRVITTAGAVLLFWPRLRQAFGLVLWHTSGAAGWALVGVTIVGLLFTWWARLTLGRFWSASVTRKAEHRVVDRGPYGLVRHPIYTGLDLATVATATAFGAVIGCVGAALIVYGCYIKARLEERFLSQELGADAYAAYARRVPMLIPFTRR